MPLAYTWGIQVEYTEHCTRTTGTGLRVRVILRLPLLSQRGDFESIVAMLRLTLAQGEGGVADVSNMDHLGRTEVELANNVIHGIEKLLALEYVIPPLPPYISILDAPNV